MFCKKCGSKLDENAKFCHNCGEQVEIKTTNENINLNNYQSNNSSLGHENVEKNSEDKKGSASLIIGIIALVLTLLMSPFVLILSIVGLVLGVKSEYKDKKRKAGIILNIIAIVLRVILLVFAAIGLSSLAKDSDFWNRLYNELDYKSSENYIAGTWNCSKFSGTGEQGEYTITMKLNKDKTFVFGEYGDLNKNHAGGTYTYEDEKEKNESNPNGYKYYTLHLTGRTDDYIIDGVKQDRAFEAKFEIGITSVNTQKQAILMNYGTYQMYYCNLEK